MAAEFPKASTHLASPQTFIQSIEHYISCFFFSKSTVIANQCGVMKRMCFSDLF